MKNLMPFFVMLGLLLTIGIAIVTITNFTLKRKIIDKGPLDDNAIKLLDKLTGLGAEMLKWGIILLFGGIGLVVLEFIPYSGQSPLPYGVVIIFIAIGFLVYHFFASKPKSK